MSLKGIVAAAALAVVAAIPTGAFLFEGKVPAPVDQIHQLPPWNGPKPGTAWDVLQIDGALQFLPWRIYMVDSMRAGYVPLWNPYSFGGAPFLANSQSAPMYPLHWLWPFDAESLLSFSAWLHVFIGGLGIYVLTRTLGASILGGLLAGTAFELCAFTVAWIQLPSVGMTAAWIPWCLWAVLRVCRAPSARNVAISSVFVGLMLLAGHLQIALYGMLATAMYGIWLCAWSRNGAGTKLLAGAAAALLGSTLAAPQVAPSIKMALGGHRVAAASADSWDAHEKQALQPAHLAALFVPGIFGMPQDPGPEKGMSGYWLGYAQPGRNYAELAFYVGPLTLPFALLAVPLLRRRPEQSFFAVLAVFAVAIALGTPVDKALFFGLPGWSATGSPGRALVLLSLSLCVLAGIYFKEVDSEPPKLGWWLYGAAVASGAVLCAYVSVSMPEEAAQVFGKPSLVPLVLFAIPLVVVLAKRKALVLPAIAFQIAAMTAVHAGLNPGSQRGIANQPFPGMDGLKGKTIAVVDQTWSLVGPAKGVVAPPNSLLPYQIGSLSGYDSVISKTIKQRLDAINGRDSAPKANGNMLFVKPGFDPQAAADAGAQFAMSASPLDLPVVYSGENWTLYRLPSPKEAPFVVAEGYNKKVLMWSGSGRSRSQAWLDSPQGAGWEKSYLTFDYDAGTIDAVYRPHSYRAGFLLAMFAACGVTGLLCQKRPAPVR